MIANSILTSNACTVTINRVTLFFSYSNLVALNYGNVRLRIDDCPRTITKHLTQFGVSDYYKVPAATLESEALIILATQEV